MRKPITTALAAAALFAIAACSSNSAPRPANIRNYGQEAQTYSKPAPAASATRASAPRQPRYSPPGTPMVSSGSVQWRSRLADAQAEARSTGRLILVATTKPGCSLCEKFKTKIVPATAGELRRMAVPYIYDITRPESGQLDHLLRDNLKGASLMPLIGFVTPDLRWVSGFWGARTAAQFRGDIATANRLRPARSAALALPDRVAAPRGAVLASVVNEYGETEWSAPGDVWPTVDPEPIDAITGSPAPLGTMPGGANAPVLAATSPPAASSAPLPAVPAAAAGAPPPAPPSVATLPPLAGRQPAPPANAAPRGRTSPWSAPVATPADSAPLRTVPAATSGEAWGRNALDRALAQIREGRYGDASQTLAEVRDRMPDSTLAREANKGGVALYNAKRIRRADSSDEKDRYLSRARRDLGASMWGSLFNS